MKNIIISLVCGVVGGFLGTRFQNTQESSILRAKQFNLYDHQNRLRGQFAMSGPDGGPGFWLMDSTGRPRISIGVYPPSEGELPHVVLNDRSGSAAGLFRLVGDSEVPYVILKHRGSDRSIYGLSQNGGGAFLVNRGTPSTTVFGNE